MMRIVGGVWRGRRLAAPPGNGTRPTADRVRQSLFDMLSHAPWAGPDSVAGARVLDVFAGTGAFGLEALSRGAAAATFMESDPRALAALRANVAALGASSQSTIVAGDVLRCPPGSRAGLIFLDPPYGFDLVPRAFRALRQAGWIGHDATVIAELGRQEPVPAIGDPLGERVHGAARLAVWRAAEAA